MLVNLLFGFLVIFNIVYAFNFLFFLLLGSQFTFFSGLFLGGFYGITAFAIADRESKLPRLFFWFAIPLTLLGIINLIPFLSLPTTNGMHMNVRDAIEFSKMHILPPLFVNSIFLNIPILKKRFK